MENKLVSHDMELLKMAMLRHEETFRQQVHELHRLYRVQKQLMAGLSRPSSSELSCRRQIRRRRRQPRRALDLHLPADECVVVTPPSSADDGLELTLAIGGAGGRCPKRRRHETESTGTATPLGSESDISGSGGSLTTVSSSTDTGGSPPYQRTTTSFRLQEATTVPKVERPPRSPWLVQSRRPRDGVRWSTVNWSWL